MSAQAVPKNVLVVEDEKIVAIEVRNRLQALGYSVPTVASSGESAVDASMRQTYDLVLMDVELAGVIDGFETARRIRRHQDVPVVFLTSHYDQSFVSRAKDVGAFGYVVKPAKERELGIAIEFALYKHVIEKELKFERDRAEYGSTRPERPSTGVL